MNRQDFPLAACSDCVQFLANGFDGMDLTPEREAQITAGVNEIMQDAYRLIVEGEDLGFSYQSCDICNQKQAAGDRYLVAGTPKETR